MKILVTGAGGQLGCDVCKILTARGIENRGVDLADFDITAAAATHAYIVNYAPDAVIHCAAYTKVDLAEDEPQLCRAVNVDGTRTVAAVCAQQGAKLLYLSSDYVFSGEGSRPHCTGDSVAPLNVYGWSKYEGERAVLEETGQSFIVRTSWAFGKNGNNFIKTMLHLAEIHDEVAVVCDQVGSPTYTVDLASLLCDMIVTDKYGVYHATNEGFCSRAELAKEIFRLVGKRTKVNPIATSEYPTRAARPLNSRMSKNKLDEMGFQRLPHWQDALLRYLKELEGAAEGEY